jgi:hypothetical protein
MKKTIFTLAVVTFIAGTLMMSCKSSTKEEKESQEKVLDARENVQDAKDSLAVANRAATAEEWKAFKEETDSVINDNESRIAELKLKMKKTGKSIDAQYQENINTLEQKNKDLKVKLDTYKNDANSDWQSFKREFKHDMDEMGQAFKNLTVDNKK